MPFKINMINILEGQGYNMKEKVLYQDNQIAIKMKKNGMSSCTSNPRHIVTRYFSLKDRVDKE